MAGFIDGLIDIGAVRNRVAGELCTQGFGLGADPQGKIVRVEGVTHPGVQSIITADVVTFGRETELQVGNVGKQVGPDVIGPKAF